VTLFDFDQTLHISDVEYDVENIIMKMADSKLNLYFLRKGYFLILARIGSLLLVTILNPPFS